MARSTIRILLYNALNFQTVASNKFIFPGPVGTWLREVGYNNVFNADNVAIPFGTKIGEYAHRMQIRYGGQCEDIPWSWEVPPGEHSIPMPCGTPHDGFIELDLPEWQALVKTGGYKFDNNNQVEYSFSPLVPRPGQFFKDHYFEMETPFTNKELEDLDLFGGALYAEAKANYNAHYKGYENAINVAPINTYTSTDSHNY